MKKRALNKRRTKQFIHTDMVDGKSLLAGSGHLGQHPGNVSACNSTYIVLSCLQYLYQFSTPSPNATVSSKNALGIFEETGLDSYAQEDLDLFFADQTPTRIPRGTHPYLAAVDGGVAPVPIDE